MLLGARQSVDWRQPVTSFHAFTDRLSSRRSQLHQPDSDPRPGVVRPRGYWSPARVPAAADSRPIDVAVLHLAAYHATHDACASSADRDGGCSSWQAGRHILLATTCGTRGRRAGGGSGADSTAWRGEMRRDGRRCWRSVRCGRRSLRSLVVTVRP